MRVAGEVWAKPLVPQMTKAFLAIELDVSHQSNSAPGIPFEAHVSMALKKELASQKSKRCLSGHVYIADSIKQPVVLVV